MYGPDRLSRFVRRIYHWLVGKEQVGKDVHGNIYWRWKETQAGTVVERREVEWARPYLMYDPNDVHPEWRMWLKRQRDSPPNEEEIQK